MTPGRKLSTRTSLLAARDFTRARPSADLRSRATLFLPRFSQACRALSVPSLVAGGMPRVGSPNSLSSIFTTVAPRSARAAVT